MQGQHCTFSDLRQNKSTVFTQSSHSAPVNFVLETSQNSSESIKRHNLKNISSAIKVQVKKYLKGRIDPDNIQETCNQTVIKIMNKESFINFKNKLKPQTSQYQHEFSLGPPVRSNKGLVNITESFSKVQESAFQVLSKQINKDILYFYKCQDDSIIVKNAKYQQYQKPNTIRSIPIFRCVLDDELKGSVWFKDRKGDIFCFHQRTLYLFKYHLEQQFFKQIELKTHESFEKIKNNHSILYIPQTDRVYYFDQKYFNASFYFQLYRPYRAQQEFSNCLSANPPRPVVLFSDIKNTKYRATYLLEHENGKLNPIIFLLCYRPKYLPLPLSLIKITQNSQSKHHVEEILSTQGPFQTDQVSLDFEQGIFSVVKKDKCPILVYFCKINGERRIVEGRVTYQKGKSEVYWSNNSFQKTLNGQKSSLKADFVNFPEKNEEKMLINDYEGLTSNNNLNYLVFESSKDKIYELSIEISKGKYCSKMFESNISK